jgi:multiple sugar transport system permease protein
VLFRTLDAFRIFDTIYVLTASTQNRSIETVSNLGYNSLLTQLNLGVGSAISVLIFLMVGVIAFLFIKLLGADPQQGNN